MNLFTRAVFSAYRYILEQRKLSLAKLKEIVKRTLHCIYRIPNLIVSILALYDPSGSHTTMVNALRRIRKRFPEIGN